MSGDNHNRAHRPTPTRAEHERTLTLAVVRHLRHIDGEPDFDTAASIVAFVTAGTPEVRAALTPFARGEVSS